MFDAQATPDSAAGDKPAVKGASHYTRGLTHWALPYLPLIPLLIGIAMLAVPTLEGIARVAWSTEQGAHGPIVLAIAVWLLVRTWPELMREARPGSPVLGSLAMACVLSGYLTARIVGSIVLESAALYLALITALYLFAGWRAMRAHWFPIVYLLFVLPPPGSFVALATQPLRLEISELAVNLLGQFGYPVARAGLNITVDQYLLEVKAACGGLNSMISLSAIGLFYAHARHGGNLRYMSVMFVAIIFMAVLANFARVLILILVTYYLGDRAAQGFIHQFAGLAMFTVAMSGVLLFDRLANPLRRALAVRVSQ